MTENRNINIDGEGVSIDVCLERIHGNIKLFRQEVSGEFKAIKLRLDSLNSFKKKCEVNADNHAEEFKTHKGSFYKLKSDFNVCQNSHDAEDTIKSKISSKAIAISALVIALGSLLVKILWL